jgi:hypothetical protein
MEGNGITNRGIVINMGKRRDRMIKKPRILGKIIRNRFDQPKSLTFAYAPSIYLQSQLPPLPLFFLSIADYK